MLARLIPLLIVKYEATSIYLAKPSAKTGHSGKPLSTSLPVSGSAPVS